jgi:hypothetical protein
VKLASPIGSAAGGSVNLSTSLSKVAKLAAHPKFVWVFNANCDGTMIYNDPVLYQLVCIVLANMCPVHNSFGTCILFSEILMVQIICLQFAIL